MQPRRAADRGPLPREVQRTTECVRWLAESNYEVHFDPSVAVSERIIFPVSSNESNGMEDARFVRFVEDDGRVIYYATYTAYNGRAILPQLLETDGLPELPRAHAEWPRRAEQRHGPLPAPHRRPLRHDLAAGRRKPLPDVFRQPAFLERPAAPAPAASAVGSGEDRQLRLADRNRGRLAGHHPRRRRRCATTASARCCSTCDDPVQGDRPSSANRSLSPIGNEREGYVPNVVYTCGALAASAAGSFSPTA